MTGFETLEDVQKFVDVLKKDPQFAQYVKQGKLELIDSRLATIDLMIRDGMVKV